MGSIAHRPSQKSIEDARNPQAEKCPILKTFLRDRQKNTKKISLDKKAIFFLQLARVRQLQITFSKFGLIATS